MPQLTRTSLGALAFASTTPAVGAATQLSAELDLAEPSDMGLEFDIDFSGAASGFLEIWGSFANAAATAGTGNTDVDGMTLLATLDAGLTNRRKRVVCDVEGRYCQIVARNQTNATLTGLTIADAVRVTPN